MVNKKFFVLLVLIVAEFFFNNITFAASSKKLQNIPARNILTLKAAVKKKVRAVHPAPIQTMLVVDLNSGKILHANNPTEKIHPASLVKLMTLYLTFDAIKNKKLDLNHKIYISKHAASMEPCKMGLKAGDYLTVRHAIASLVVKSHNDNAAAIAEKISGSEQSFSRLMNAAAKKLKMNNTFFSNASGLHHDSQVTTAYDLVKLIMAIKKENPRLYPLLSQTSFEHRGKIYNTHNKVLKLYQHAKAGKTGFTSRSGFNLITHATYGNKDIVAVITGFPSCSIRDRTMVSLLDQHLGVTTDHSPFIRKTAPTYTHVSLVSSNQMMRKKKLTKKKMRI